MNPVMRPRLPRDRTADRLLAGSVAPADAPPGFGRTAELLAEAASGAAPVRVDAGLIVAMAAAVTDASVAAQPVQSRKLARTLTAKAAAATAAVVLTTSGAAATTGNLPDAAQQAVADAMAHVGVDLPDPATDRPSGTSSNTTDADEHGDTVSGTAQDTDATEADKGDEISTAASDGQGSGATGEAADDTPAPIDTLDPGGPDTGTTASDGRPDTPPDPAGDGSASGGEAPPVDPPYGSGSLPAQP